MNLSVREATPDDRLGVRQVLDAAMLDVREDLQERIAVGDVLVATDDSNDDQNDQRTDGKEDTSAPILGALVLVPRSRGAHIDAVAVRRARRAQGVGSALVRAAAERHPRLTAEFDPSVRPFYESLEFDVEAIDGESGVEDEGGRLRGRYESRLA